MREFFLHFHPFIVLLFIFFSLILTITISLEFIKLNEVNRNPATKADKNFSPKSVTKLWLVLTISGIFITFLFLTFSTFVVARKSAKVVVRYKGDKQEFIIDEYTPLWILKTSAQEYYDGYKYYVETNLPYDREYIAYIGLDKEDYNKNLLQNFIGIKIYKSQRPKWFIKILLIFSLIILYFTLIPAKINISSKKFELKQVTDLKDIFKIIFVVLISYYFLIASYHIFYYEISFKRALIYIWSPLMFYLLTLLLADKLRNSLEYDITLTPWNNTFWLLILSAIIGIGLSLSPLALKYGSIKRLCQPSMLALIVAASGAYWHSNIERKLRYRLIVFLLLVSVGGIVSLLVRDLAC